MGCVPGPVLAALAERAAEDPGRLTDDELPGAAAAARRSQARAEFLELKAVAEFARRRSARFEAARARKDFGAADAIRNQLRQAGVLVEDTPLGPRWELRK